jgi:hypothetical protein
MGVEVALITSFERSDAKNLSRHKTDVSARVFVFGDGSSGPLLQISTYGSADRVFPGKVSQTVQLDRQAATALWKILGDEYGLK